MKNKQEFEIVDNKLIKYNEVEGKTEVIIPEGVTVIGELAFSGCQKLTSISIPDSVTEIEHGAFWDCKNLKVVVLPNNLKKIERQLFCNCGNLIKVEIPDSIEKIEDLAFAYCERLTNISIPEGVTKIDSQAFAGCISLKEIIIPNSVKEIGYDAFSFCESLTSIEIPDGVTEIGNWAFSRCINLKDITLPDSILKIGFEALACSNLQTINIYSYNIFNKLDEKSKLIALISTIKNYHNGKIKYSDEDMQLFKEYIKENKYNLFEYAKSNIELVNFMLNNMGQNFITYEDAANLLSIVDKENAEIITTLLTYSDKMRDKKINPLDNLDLGEFNIDNDDNNQKKLTL